MDITMIAVATLISQVLLLIIAIKNLSDKNDVFGFSLKFISLKSNVLQPVFSLSIPVILQKAAFAFGKAAVNSMGKVFGNLTVGALGISNNINGLITNLQTGFQDGGASIISQNIGAKKLDRAFRTFKILIVVNIVIGVIGWLLLNIFINNISYLFSSSISGVDTAFQQTIIGIFKYDSFGSCVPLGINTAVLALLFAFDYSKLALFIDFCRIYAFRIPTLWILQHYSKLGSESVGIVMAVSNILAAVLSLISAFYVIKIIKNNREKYE
jgi:Na+-driven multidrug efflux pump